MTETTETPMTALAAFSASATDEIYIHEDGDLWYITNGFQHSGGIAIATQNKDRTARRDFNLRREDMITVTRTRWI